VDTLISIVVIGLGTTSLVAVSRRSSPHRRSHGFFRFFAFEAILCLVVLNAPRWFSRPGAPRQLLSWVLLAGSLLLALGHFLLLPITHTAGSI
jgi:hypothetical protein